MERLPLLTLFLAAGTAALQLLSDSSALQFERASVARGELWRLITAHFIHFNEAHLCWDLGMFVALGAIVENYSRRVFLLCVIASVASISAALWAWQPQLSVYRGLSGVDSALFGFVGAWLIRAASAEKHRMMIGIAVFGLVGFLVKTAWEWSSGSTLFVDRTGVFVSVPLAHFVGALAGLLVAVAQPPFRREGDTPVEVLKRDKTGQKSAQLPAAKEGTPPLQFW